MKTLVKIFLILSLIGCSSNSIDKLSIDSPFEEEKDYEIEIINSVKNNEHNVDNQQTVTKIKFHVNSVSDSIIEGNWQIGETFIKNLNTDNDVSSIDDLSQFRGIHLIINYNVNSGKIDIKNFEEVHGNLKNAFVKYYNPNGIADSSDMYLKFKNDFEKTANSDQVLINNYFPEVKVLFNEINKDYVLNQKFLIDSFRPYNYNLYAPIYSSTQLVQTDDGMEINRKESVSHSDFIDKIKNVIIQKYGESAVDTVAFEKLPEIKYEVDANVYTNSENQVSSIEITKTEGGPKGNKTTHQVINIIE